MTRSMLACCSLALSIALPACAAGGTRERDGGSAIANDDGATRSDGGHRDPVRPPLLDAEVLRPDARATGTPSLEIVSGNRQLIPEMYPAGAALYVRALDGAGRAEAGVTVRFTIAGGESGGVHAPEVITDAEGLARTTIVGGGVSRSVSFSTWTVRASRADASTAFVDFTLTTHDTGDGIPLPAHTQLDAPSGRDLGTARGGSVLSRAVQVRVVAQAGPYVGMAIPGIAVHLEGNARCANEAITDATGLGVCDVELLPFPGEHRLSIVIGDATRYDGVRVVIE